MGYETIFSMATLSRHTSPHVSRTRTTEAHEMQKKGSRRADSSNHAACTCTTSQGHDGLSARHVEHEGQLPILRAACARLADAADANARFLAEAWISGMPWLTRIAFRQAGRAGRETLGGRAGSHLQRGAGGCSLARPVWAGKNGTHRAALEKLLELGVHGSLPLQPAVERPVERGCAMPSEQSCACPML